MGSGERYQGHAISRDRCAEKSGGRQRGGNRRMSPQNPSTAFGGPPPRGIAGRKTAVTTDAPILFFDSGVGGLSVLAPTRALLPNAPIVYAADSAAFPSGTRSEEEIAERVPALLCRLVERFNPRLVVIACNTASTIALDHARAALDIPVVGTVPAIKPASEVSKTRVIGVLGTEATVRQPYVDNLAREFAADCTIIRHGSAELVAFAEAKLAGEEIGLDAVAAAVAPLRATDALDVVVLACTHFPLLREELARALPNVTLVAGGPGIARRIAWLPRGQPWPDEPSTGIAVFTGPPPPPALVKALASFGLSEIETFCPWLVDETTRLLPALRQRRRHEPDQCADHYSANDAPHQPVMAGDERRCDCR